MVSSIMGYFSKTLAGLGLSTLTKFVSVAPKTLRLSTKPLAGTVKNKTSSA